MPEAGSYFLRMDPPPGVDRDEDDPELREGPLDEREGALKEREGELEERDGALKEREGEIDEREGALEEREGALKEREGGLNDRGGALEERDGALEEREGAFNDREGELNDGVLRAGAADRVDGVGVLIERDGLLAEDPDRFTLRDGGPELGDGEVSERGEIFDLDGEAEIPGEGVTTWREPNSRRLGGRETTLPPEGVGVARACGGEIDRSVPPGREPLF